MKLKCGVFSFLTTESFYAHRQTAAVLFCFVFCFFLPPRRRLLSLRFRPQYISPAINSAAARLQRLDAEDKERVGLVVVDSQGTRGDVDGIQQNKQ